jgi:hypothetical protein
MIAEFAALHNSGSLGSLAFFEQTKASTDLYSAQGKV